MRKAHLATILPDSLIGTLQTKKQSGDLEKLYGPYRTLTIPIDKPYYRAIADRLREGNATLIDSMAGLADLDSYDTVPGTRDQLRRAFSHLPDADSLDVCYSIRLNSLTMSFCDRAEEALFKKGDLSDADLDSLLSKKAERTSWFKRRMIRSLGRLDLSRTEGMQRVAHAIVRAISAIMFILMPFTAVLLLWFFFRDRYYWEHLIFSVHTHTIYFLFFIIILLSCGHQSGRLARMGGLAGRHDLPGLPADLSEAGVRALLAQDHPSHLDDEPPLSADRLPSVGGGPALGIHQPVSE